MPGLRQGNVADAATTAPDDYVIATGETLGTGVP